MEQGFDIKLLQFGHIKANGNAFFVFFDAGLGCAILKDIDLIAVHFQNLFNLIWVLKQLQCQIECTVLPITRVIQFGDLFGSQVR